MLVEKPAARRVAELERLIAAGGGAAVQRARRLQSPLPPRLLKARELVDAGALGPLMFVRGRYGHGGRIGYDSEWRADPSAPAAAN